MRMLSAPVKGDPQVVSGESGAVGMGVISSIMLDDVYAELRELLGLGADSQVLLFSTEGDTDPERYRDIVWGGMMDGGGSRSSLHAMTNGTRPHPSLSLHAIKNGTRPSSSTG